MEELHYKIFSRFEDILDPWVERTGAHSLPALLFIVLRTFLTEDKIFYKMELFAQAYETWLKRIAGMASVPSIRYSIGSFRR